MTKQRFTFGVNATFLIEVDEEKSTEEQLAETWNKIQENDIQFYEIQGELKDYLLPIDLEDSLW